MLNAAQLEALVQYLAAHKMDRFPSGPAVRRAPFWQAVGILLLAYIVVVWVVPILPGSAIVPKSVVLQYMVTVLVAAHLRERQRRAWRRFKEPIQAVLIEPRLKVVRAAVPWG